ncbi:hypothetical protein AAC387_Pa04g1904 [Persea americana]
MKESFIDSLRKTFKSNGSSKHMGRKSVEGPEERSILLDHGEDASKSMDRREVVVNVDGDNGNRRGESTPIDNKSNIWRESSYEFWTDTNRKNGEIKQPGMASMSESDEFNFQHRPSSDDPPSKLIGQFLHKQKASGEMSLDMDLEMDELCHEQNLSPVRESSSPQQSISPKELRVSFQDPSTHQFEIAAETIRQRRNGSSEDEDGDGGVDKKSGVSSNSGEVLKCTSNSSFRRNSNLLQAKTKSRLLDPPSLEDEVKRSGRSAKSGQAKQGKSGILKSGMQGRKDEDEEDPFLDEDLPDKYKKANLGAVTVLQWFSLFVILAALVCSLTIPFLVRQTVWDLHLWKWVVMVLVLICGRLLSGWGIRIVVYLFERNFLLRKRVLYFIYGVRKAVQNCLWLGLVLIAWHYIFDNKVERETKSKTLPYVTKILVCLLVGTFVWLVKTLLVKVLASSFHVSAYFDRIQESLFNQYVIETLSGQPLIESQRIQEEEEKVMAEVQKLQNAGAKMPADLKAAAFSSGRVIGSGRLKSPKVAKNSKFSGAVSKPEDDGITIDHLHKLNQRNISAWNMKRLINIVRNGVLSTLDEQIQDENQEDESAMQIRSELEAKLAARKIFHNVAQPGSKYIYLVDLMRFMKEDEAIKAMGLFEGAKDNKRISKTALKNWVVSAFRERKALSLTLNDTKTAVNKLHQMVRVLVVIIIVVIWLLILGIATTHLLVLVSSQLLLVVFIFGNTCKTVFEAIIFLFAMHPFDVGDRCEIDGVQMVVEEMNILTTVFLRYDNQKITYPNSVLATKPISNYYRSPDMGDAIDYSIHVSTPVDKVATMKERIKGYIESKTEHWYPDPMIVVRDVDDMNKLKISVWLQHRMNYQDMGERWVRRAALVEEMVKILRELDIEYRLLPLDINVRNMPPLSSTRLPSTWTTFA